MNSHTFNISSEKLLWLDGYGYFLIILECLDNFKKTRIYFHSFSKIGRHTMWFPHHTLLHPRYTLLQGVHHNKCGYISCSFIYLNMFFVDMWGTYLLKIIIQESVENRVGAARRDANKVEDQVDGHHALRALEHLRHLRHQAEQAAMWQSQMKYLLKQIRCKKGATITWRGAMWQRRWERLRKEWRSSFSVSPTSLAEKPDSSAKRRRSIDNTKNRVFPYRYTLRTLCFFTLRNKRILR